MYFLCFFFLLIFAAIFLILYKRNQSKNVSKAFYGQELVKAKLQIQEHASEKAASTLHDHIGQLLCLAKLNLNRISASSTPYDYQKIAEVKDWIGQSILDLRDLSRALKNETLYTKGLLPAIKMEVESMQNAGIKTVNLETEGRLERLDTETEVFLFYIFQQALCLLLQQSSTSSILIKAICTAEQFYLAIISHGKKKYHDTTLLHENSWHILQTRAKLIGATLEITPAPEAVTTIHIDLPLNI